MASTMLFGPDDEDAFFRRREELAADFGDWLARRPGVAPDERQPAVFDLQLLLDWKWGYDDGDLGRWNSADVGEFLLSWCPRKVSAPADLAQVMPRNVGLAMLFLDDVGLLQATGGGVALDRHARSLQSRFMDQMASPQNYGMAKSLFAGIDLEDLDPNDPAALDRVLAEFNALPEEERAAILDPAASGPTDQPRHAVLPPPRSDEVAAAAEASGVLTAFDILTDYFAAPGKPLTKTDAIKIADAAALAELLGTGEKPVEEIGDRAFTRGSSREFARVDFWVNFAKASGALRHYRKHMVGVGAWQRRRRSDPGTAAVKAVSVLLTSGPLAVSGGYYTELQELLDLAAVPMLVFIAEHGEMPVAEIVERSREVIQHGGVAEQYPGALRSNVTRLLDLLAECGVVTRTSSPPATDATEPTATDGGLVAATPIGVGALIDLAGQLGLPVTVPPPAEEQDAAGLAGLLARMSDPAAWWDLAGGWLAAQPDYPVAVRSLLDALGEQSLAMLVGALAELPDDQTERMAPVLRSLAESATSLADETCLAAVVWVTDHDEEATDGLDPAITFGATIATLGASCDAGGAEEAMAIVTRLSEGEAMEFFTRVGEVSSPRAVSLLDAVGRLHPDKRLAKAARKELFRLRSRLAATGR